MLAGIDGCKGGWVVVLEEASGRRVIERVNSFGELTADYRFDLALIDIPIGLMDSQPRSADLEARRFLGVRGCCVFPAPYRAITLATAYAEACALRELVDGKRMSQQAFGILPKIREVDSIMTEGLQARIKEGHPEVTFAVLNDGQALLTQKRRRGGSEDRLRLLRPYFPELEALSSNQRPTGVSLDDLLDAYAMLWTARRVKQGVHVPFPKAPQLDQRGLRAEILA